MLISLVLAVFTGGAGLLVNSTMAQRLPGQTITGNKQVDPARQRALEQAVRLRPDDPAAHRALAQARLDNRDFVGALKEFTAAARLDPKDAISQAYGGWIVYQAGLVDEALRQLDAAITADPNYPDAHLFRGIVLLRSKQDSTGAAAELERYLAAVPAGPSDREIRALLDDARRQATAPTSR